MDPEEKKISSELDEKATLIFSDFMIKVAKFDELAVLGSGLLFGFQQGLELLPRPSIQKTSELVDGFIKANNSNRVKAYVEAGYINVHDGVQHISKLFACQHRLQDHLSEAKGILNELESLMENAVVVLQAATKGLSLSCAKHSSDGLLHQPTSFEEERESHHCQKPEISDYAAMKGVVYSMVKQDYTMQEKIVSSLNLKSLSGELESYCLMWSLRPFINDEVMHEVWRLIP